MAEILDYFDDNMRYLGSTDRDIIHAKGLWHKTFHCWVVQIDGTTAYVLFQRRGPKKRAFPNKLDITAAGHLDAGEDPLDGVREFQEELGVPVDADNLRFLGIRVSASIVGSDINREFNHVYMIRSDLPIEKYRLQQDEVAGLVRMPVAQGLSLFAGRVQHVHVDGIELDDNGDRSRVSYEATLEDIIPRKDNYYLKVFIMAERLGLGLEPVCI